MNISLQSTACVYWWCRVSLTSSYDATVSGRQSHSRTADIQLSPMPVCPLATCYCSICIFVVLVELSKAVSVVSPRNGLFYRRLSNPDRKKRYWSHTRVSAYTIGSSRRETSSTQLHRTAMIDQIVRRSIPCNKSESVVIPDTRSTYANGLNCSSIMKAKSIGKAPELVLVDTDAWVLCFDCIHQLFVTVTNQNTIHFSLCHDIHSCKLSNSFCSRRFSSSFSSSSWPSGMCVTVSRMLASRPRELSMNGSTTVCAATNASTRRSAWIWRNNCASTTPEKHHV